MGFTRADFGAFDYFLLRELGRSKGRTKRGVLYYRNPLGYEWHDMDEEECDSVASRFNEERTAAIVASSFTELLAQIDRPATKP